MLFIATGMTLHSDRFDVLHDLLEHYFPLHGHVRGHQDLLLWVGELFMFYIASGLTLHSERFDVLHDLLEHYFPLHGHVHGHQDQLLAVGEYLHVDHCIYFAFSC